MPLTEFSYFTRTNSRCVVRVSKEDFWSGVSQATTAGLQLLSRVELVGKPKVGKFDHPKFLEKDDIFRLEISVDDVKLVAVLDGVDNLE